MASFESLYNDITHTIKAAQIRFAEMQQARSVLERQNEELLAERAGLQQKIEELEEKLKLLVITKTVLNKEDNKKTKKQINDWVREIDDCIALLSNR